MWFTLNSPGIKCFSPRKGRGSHISIFYIELPSKWNSQNFGKSDAILFLIDWNRPDFHTQTFTWAWTEFGRWITPGGGTQRAPEVTPLRRTAGLRPVRARPPQYAPVPLSETADLRSGFMRHFWRTGVPMRSVILHSWHVLRGGVHMTPGRRPGPNTMSANQSTCRRAPRGGSCLCCWTSSWRFCFSGAMALWEKRIKMDDSSWGTRMYWNPQFSPVVRWNSFAPLTLSLVLSVKHWTCPNSCPGSTGQSIVRLRLCCKLHWWSQLPWRWLQHWVLAVVLPGRRPSEGMTTGSTGKCSLLEVCRFRGSLGSLRLFWDLMDLWTFFAVPYWALLASILDMSENRVGIPPKWRTMI